MATSMKPYHKNPRQITGKQIKDLGAWLSELGDLSGIVHDLNTDEIIGGNQRGRVFNVNECEVELVDGPHEPDEQGTVAHGFIVWKGKRYAYRQVRWNEKQAEKANIVANKAGGGWDFDTLANEFEVSDLIELGFEAGELGIDLGGGTDDDAEPQIDRAEELREQWGVEPGQLWRLPSRTPGQEHRLICGDCTDAAVVERVMGGERAALMLTDPPYGINIVKISGGLRAADSGGAKPVTIGSIRSRRPDTVGGVKNIRGSDGAANMIDATLYRPVAGDDRPFDPEPVMALAENSILFGGNYYASRLPDSRCWIVWDKDNTGNFADAELAWTSFDKGVKLYKFTWNGLVREGDRKLEGVKRVHPTQKPVGLFQMILNDFSEGGQIVIDPYHGAGATLLACENSTRACRAIEIDEGYVAVALQRYVDAFGIEPELVFQKAN